MPTNDSPGTLDIFWTVRLRWSDSLRRDAPGDILDRLDAHYDHWEQAAAAARFVAEWSGLPPRRFVVTAHVEDQSPHYRRSGPGSPIVKDRKKKSGRHPAPPCRHSIFCRHMA